MGRRTLLYVILSSAVFACDTKNVGTEPERVTGMIAGTVEVDGAPLAGVTVTLDGESTRTTDASGVYLFGAVDEGAHVVSISGFPSDVAFPSTSASATISSEGQRVEIDFSGNTVIWDWDSEDQVWYRTGYGEASTYRNQDGDESRLGAEVMVALYVEQYTVSPPSGVSGSALPSSRTTGSGKAFVFAEGKVAGGTWERESESDWFMLTDENGEIMMVPPGKVWVSLVPANRGLTYR
ncbi:MAG: DUF3048 C-terminal domain-containing protein [Halobacteriales archaeon]|nr:DUF3048 C-terminal domain-containing protein [Halobacteriales archaeon]